MAKIIFKITYSIAPEKREDYLELAGKMKAHLSGKMGKNYSIYENKTKANKFSEIFVCNSQDEFDHLEDHDDITSDLVEKINALLDDGKMQYSTLVEVE
ncbi:MAG: hypothetical protein HY960_02725 [Ignavibacteriae bacterium]|nr:hypothetical protein [Ignavibacteriota bacterium]